MKTMRKLFLSLLAITMLFALSACNLFPVGPTEPVIESHTVTFYNNGEVYKTVEVEPGAALTLPKAPKGESGKGLVGWTTIDGDVEEVIDPETFVVEGDVSLYALWADVYTVVINADNGTAFTVMEVFAGTVIEQPADPVKEGCKFIEWRDALNENTYDFAQPVYADLTIKALYGDGAPNRVSDTKWDFSTGIHGNWYGGQGSWNRVDNGINATDMVYTTTEDGYAAWGFTMTDSLENIPVIDGNNAAGYGMKFLYNEGISVEASKAKLVVAYIKPKYYPIDITGNLNDQFRISILTGNGGMIYGYGSGCEDWAIHSAGVNKELVQADVMEDGWIRVQFKIHALSVWSEDTILKSLSIAMVQRPSTPVMDIISVKSIELLDQEEFIDPHTIDYVTKNEWDMSKEEDTGDWTASMQNGSNTTSVTSAIGENGIAYTYGHTNAWRGITLDQAQIEIAKCSGIFSATVDLSGMAPSNFRIYILTDAGGDLYKNSGRDDVSCYYVATGTADPAEGWTVTPNADGTVTICYDLTKLEYWTKGTVLQGLTFVTVDSTANGTIVYKSISLADTVKVHNCETDGHIWNDATCTVAKTCAVCGATEGEMAAHTWTDATCTAPKTCSVCGAKEGEMAAHNYVDGVCSVCGREEDVVYTPVVWDMKNAEDSAAWYATQNKDQTKTGSITVTEEGSVATYTNANAWKGMLLRDTEIDLTKLTGTLSFTYSSDMTMGSFRVYVLTDKGGHLTHNDAATAGVDKQYFYAEIKTANIAASESWTSTVNEDGTTTVTFDLNTIPYYAEGAVLNGLTIVTVNSGTATGSVLYTEIAIN